MTCSQCRNAEAEVKLRGCVLCVSCLVKAAIAGVDGAERIANLYHARQARLAKKESERFRRRDS